MSETVTMPTAQPERYPLCVCGHPNSQHATRIYGGGYPFERPCMAPHCPCQDWVREMEEEKP